MAREKKTDSKRIYQTRFSNWEVIASYLLKFRDFEYVFSCFQFPSNKYSRKYFNLFNKYLTDIKKPRQIKVLCGRHRGCKPGLGFALDKLVFILLYKDYLEPNESKKVESEKIYVDNDMINKAIQSVLKSAEGEDQGEDRENRSLSDFSSSNTLSEQKSPCLNKDFKYSRFACNRFAIRHFFPNRYEVSPPAETDGDTRIVLQQSAYAHSKHYPSEGFPLEGIL